MKADKNTDIIKLILEDHKSLKHGIKILKSEDASSSEKQKALRKFLDDLQIHAKVEEQSLYDNVASTKEVRDSVLEGYEEHAIADHLLNQLEASDFEDGWDEEIAAKAKVLAEVVEHHVEEEEEELLPEVRSAFAKHELLEMGQIYAEARDKMRSILRSEPRTERIETQLQH